MSDCNRECIERFAGYCKALANTNRLRVYLQVVAHCGRGTAWELEEGEDGCSAGEVGEALGIAPSTLSYNLRDLQRAGLITLHRQGKTVACWARSGPLAEVSPLLVRQPTSVNE